MLYVIIGLLVIASGIAVYFDYKRLKNEEYVTEVFLRELCKINHNLESIWEVVKHKSVHFTMPKPKPKSKGKKS